MDNCINKKDLDLIFEYIKSNGFYNDKQDEFHSKDIVSRDEIEALDNKMYEFSYLCMRYTVDMDKYYFDTNDYFENYHSYIEHNGVKIESYLVYGQGSYFSIKLADGEFKDELCVNAVDMIDGIGLEEAKLKRKREIEKTGKIKVSYPRDWDGNNSPGYSEYIDVRPRR